MGYHCVQWDIDSLDWKDYGTDAIIKKVLEHKHLGNGSIILMHNGAKYTPAALEAIIMGLKEKGYEFIYNYDYEQ
jgi:peptidoglycan/xylan/chitin deacetylase (PgdA/CDA1 family)